MENNHGYMKISRKRWEDITDSNSSKASEPGSANNVHPEIEILKRVLAKLTVPITIYLGNLSYDLNDENEILVFLSLPPQELPQVSLKLLEIEGRFSGRAEITVESMELALHIVEFHGRCLDDRPVYMNLDGFYGRGQQYKKTLNIKKTRPNKRKHKYKKKPLQDANVFD